MIPVVHAITSITIAAILLYASAKDFKYRTISRRIVAIVFIIVLAYRLIAGITAEVSFTFLYVLIAFLLITFLSRERFGLGDSLLIGAVALFFGTTAMIQQFIYAMVLSALALWFVYFIKDKQYKDLKGLFRNEKSRVVPIDKVVVGSILASDNFMCGLSENDISKLKRDGRTELEIKQPYLPFIPCICFGFILTSFLLLI